MISAIVLFEGGPGPGNPVAEGRPAPAFAGTTLDGAALSLADLHGRPVIVNFLMFDPPAPARDFIADHGATWPTIDDPEGTIRAAYRAIARPQTYFIDRDGVIRRIQVGQLSDADFERLYASISGPAGSPAQ